ncbi:hypothetical protein F4780DRAFT_764504 [Xylariomycetidae sp. FL0641]|nr:hypothetical protein F4780DRAFT_764504 [Xylariomycetidae sp. FL0641]
MVPFPRLPECSVGFLHQLRVFLVLALDHPMELTHVLNFLSDFLAVLALDQLDDNIVCLDGMDGFVKIRRLVQSSVKAVEVACEEVVLRLRTLRAHLGAMESSCIENAGEESIQIIGMVRGVPPIRDSCGQSLRGLLKYRAFNAVVHGAPTLCQHSRIHGVDSLLDHTANYVEGDCGVLGHSFAVAGCRVVRRDGRQESPDVRFIVTKSLVSVETESTVVED